MVLWLGWALLCWELKIFLTILSITELTLAVAFRHKSIQEKWCNIYCSTIAIEMLLVGHIPCLLFPKLLHHIWLSIFVWDGRAVTWGPGFAWIGSGLCLNCIILWSSFQEKSAWNPTDVLFFFLGSLGNCIHMYTQCITVNQFLSL